MRYAALSLLLCSCTLFSPLSSDEQEQLSVLERSAKHHYEGNNLGQALDVIDRGLEIDPEHYQLNVLRGAIMLRRKAPSNSEAQRRVDQALASFETLFDTRAPDRHEPTLLFFYGLGLQQRARRHLGQAHLLQRKGDPEQADAMAELQQLGAEDFDQSDELFRILVQRGELLRMSHYHLMLAAHDRGRDEAFIEHSDAYLQLARKAQEANRVEIARTSVPAYEDERKRNKRELEGEELDVCSLLAEHHYAKGDYEQALEMLSRVLVLDEKRSADYYNRGRVLLNLGRDAEAKADFRRFLVLTDLPPTSEKAILAAETIARQ